MGTLAGQVWDGERNNQFNSVSQHFAAVAKEKHVWCQAQFPVPSVCQRSRRRFTSQANVVELLALLF